MLHMKMPVAVAFFRKRIKSSTVTMSVPFGSNSCVFFLEFLNHLLNVYELLFYIVKRTCF